MESFSFCKKYYILLLPCQYGLFVQTCVSKNSIVFKDMIFYLLWYDEAAIYAEILIFSHSIVA